MKIVKNVLKVTLILVAIVASFIAGYKLANARFTDVKKVDKMPIGSRVLIETRDGLGRVVDTKSYFTK